MSASIFLLSDVSINLSSLIFLLSVFGFITMVIILLVGAARTRMIVFTPLALYPPTLLLLGFLLDNPAYYEYQLVLFFLLIGFGIASPLIGICLLLTSNIKREQFIYFSVCTVIASIPLLIFLFFGIRNWLNS